MVFSAGRAAPALRQTGFYDPRHAVPGQSRLPCPPFFTLSAFVKFSERQREKGGVRQRRPLPGGLHGVAERLLRSQDRKCGTGHIADPVFFEYSGIFFTPGFCQYQSTKSKRYSPLWLSLVHTCVKSYFSIKFFSICATWARVEFLWGPRRPLP